MSTHESGRAVVFMGDLVVLARQARLIREARQRGYAPVAVVGTGTDLDRLAALSADPAHPLAGLAEVLQVPDAAITAVLPAVQPLLRRHDVRGVISVGEVFVEPAGVLADCLGLPGAGTAASLICRNKLLQRTTLPEFSPWFEVVPGASRAGTGRPGPRRPARPAGGLRPPVRVGDPGRPAGCRPRTGDQGGHRAGGDGGDRGVIHMTTPRMTAHSPNRKGDRR